MRDEPSNRKRFPGLWASYQFGHYAYDLRPDYLLPSGMQGRLDRFVRPLSKRQQRMLDRFMDRFVEEESD
jgi:hypothetical protein